MKLDFVGVTCDKCINFKNDTCQNGFRQSIINGCAASNGWCYWYSTTSVDKPPEPYVVACIIVDNNMSAEELDSVIRMSKDADSIRVLVTNKSNIKASDLANKYSKELSKILITKTMIDFDVNRYMKEISSTVFNNGWLTFIKNTDISTIKSAIIRRNFPPVVSIDCGGNTFISTTFVNKCPLVFDIEYDTKDDGVADIKKSYYYRLLDQTSNRNVVIQSWQG